MKFVSLCILAFLSLVNAMSLDNTRARVEWESFKSTYGKKYTSTTEDSRRMSIFTRNKDRIVKHNQQASKQGYKLAMNKFGDLDQVEYLKLNGYRRPSRTVGFRNESLRRIVAGDPYRSPPDAHSHIPDSIDWTKRGAVTAVKDQGQCGSCWSFSATGALEGQHFLRSGKLVSLSEQNLLDCTLAYGNFACEGGWMDAAFQYIKDNHGIDTERSYPYKATLDRCRYHQDDKGAVDHGFVDIRPEGDEEKLKEAVALVGPIAVAIDASYESFQFYSSGVYNEPECSTQILDHAVLAVGYGTEKDGTRYWLIKNSWGTDWGDHGYMKMSRNRRNQCGIATAASYPKV